VNELLKIVDMSALPRKQTSASTAAMTDPDPNPFADCDVIVCYGGAKLADKHLPSTIHCVNEEIIRWLKRREQRRREHNPKVMGSVETKYP